MREVDIVVVGGGTSGAIAAIQAARAGSNTLLIEKSGILGGTTTLAGVALPGLFHAWGRQVIAGIGWDLVARSMEITGDALPDFEDYRRSHSKLQIPVNPTVYASVLDDAALAAGAELHLHTMIAGVRPTDKGWVLDLCGKEGVTPVHAARVIDATGDADIVGQAGLLRIANAQLQPGTLMSYLTGYDMDALDHDALQRAHDDALQTGDLRFGDFSETVEPIRKLLRSHGQNTMHVVGISGSTSADRTRAEVEARRALMRVYRFLRRQPGLERIRIEYSATQVGVRETYTIDGLSRITVQDYSSGRVWDDAVCYSFYPIDVHRHAGDGIDIRPLAEGVVATIPLSAMVPRGSSNLLVAGRTVCGDQEANSAYRVQATAMATGQAAGAAAALSVQEDCAVADVPLDLLDRVLLANGAIVPTRPTPSASSESA